MLKFIFSSSARSISEDFSSGGGGDVTKPSRDADESFCQNRERDRSRERDDRDEGKANFQKRQI